ncbi:MAG: NAD-dependent DNA ligase LigA [Candidatus Omnitrophica bacterium]|nr:NAD-dependent DNA ligase LigA [Candidatus Omnitrophota bacterium]
MKEDLDKIKKRIEDLRQRIRHHDYLYYVLSQPEISDKEYDDLMRQLKELEERYPQFKSDDSPTARVSGGVLEGFKTVEHKEKMLSLDNVYTFEELSQWQERILKVLGKEKIEFVVEHKIDGVSANLTYQKGRLMIGATRGDGSLGEDVTQNIKTIRAIPLILRGKKVPDFIEIRGEVYMERKDFISLNKEREKLGEVLFANPRNAASGSLKLLDTSIVAQRKLNFFAHSLGAYEGVQIKSQWEFLTRLKEWGMRVNPYSCLCKNLKEVIAYCQQWQEKREKIPYDVDGVVVKVNDLLQQKRLGTTLKSPRWAVAYKFPAQQATTEVLKIKVNVGRTGVLTPVAELKPVECGGVIIRHVTLHNFEEMRRLNIKEGDRVLIERAGDVIPKVVKVVESKGKKAFSIPAVCPVCKGKVVKEKEEEVAYRCINSSCPAQLERGLLHFASRQAMDIEGMGEAVVSQLVRLGLVHNFADIYKLTARELARLELFKEKKINNLLSAIQRSKQQPLSRLIYALGIRHVGEKAAYVLAREFKTMDSLISKKKEDFDRIPEVGPIMAESIAEYLSQPQTRRLIEELRKAGLNFKEEVSEVKTGLTGKTVVFTGELKNYTRLEAEDLVRRLGGNVSSSVSKNTDLVVLGENPGSKYEKAKKLGIKIINEEEFLNLIKEK